jgi:2-dehydropantoate 2-reductase
MINVEKMNVLTFGAGAIGTYMGGSLALAGHRVTFIEQPKVVEELQERGLRLELRNAERGMQNAENPSFIIPPSSFTIASSLTEALQYGPFDIALFALKSFDTAAALDGMKPYADQLPPILCLSNGVDNEPAIAAALGPDKVIAGTVTSSVARRAAGDILLEKSRGVGVADGHPLSLWLATALNEAGLNARLYRRAADMKWSKMLTNLLVNTTVAILDMPPRQVLSHPGLFRLEIAMLREALAVMKAGGMRVVDTPKTPVRLLALAAHLPAFIARPLMVKFVGGGRGGKMPSFHLDLHAGRGKSEVEWLNGAVVRHGEKFGVPTPVNRILTETLLDLTRGEIPLTEFSGQPEKLLSLVRTTTPILRA